MCSILNSVDVQNIVLKYSPWASDKIIRWTVNFNLFLVGTLNTNSIALILFFDCYGKVTNVICLAHK